MDDRQIPARSHVIDSHTAGEPTRCVIAGLPDLGSGPLSQRLERLRSDFDSYRRAILCEPRGSDVLVGAYLVEPVDAACTAGVIFFNNAGYLGMCGHGMIGVAVTLAHLNRITIGEHWIETPVGAVRVELQTPNRVSIRNVPAYRHRAAVTVDVPGYGPVTGDVAWGGNWFFLVGKHSFGLKIEEVEALTSFTWEIRRALTTAGVTGANGAEIDHIELFGPAHGRAHGEANHSRNFVLCPGKAYDRSPCGTGTSAKMACLAADGLLEPGRIWRQEGILGTVFEGSFEFESAETRAEFGREDQDGLPSASGNRRVIPTVTGSAYVTAETALVFDAADPFRLGVPE
ncbi:MAG: proline racemase family protein [Terracidiphilus sp.]